MTRNVRDSGARTPCKTAALHCAFHSWLDITKYVCEPLEVYAVQTDSRAVQLCAMPTRERPPGTTTLCLNTISVPVEARRRRHPFVNYRGDGMNHPSHFFVAIDPGDCPRCIGCDVRSGSRHAEPPCPDAAPSKCVHNSIARCEQNPAWCTDCHAWVTV